MNLRNKSAAIIFFVMLILIAAFYVILRIIILGGFDNIEKIFAPRKIRDVKAMLQNEVGFLDTTIKDWSCWDDSYQFIQDGNEKFRQINLPKSVFNDLRLNILIFIKNNGEIVYGSEYDSLRGELIPLSEDIKKYVLQNELLINHIDPRSKFAGILFLPRCPLLLASRPVLTSDYEGPIYGTIIMGRYINDFELKRLRRKMHINFDLLNLNSDTVFNRYSLVVTNLFEPEATKIRPDSEQTLHGYTILNNIFGEKNILIEVKIKREIYLQSLMSMKYVMLSLIAVSLFLCFAILLILKSLVLDRLEFLGVGVEKIGTSGDLTRRIELDGTDELSQLAKDINGMLEKLDSSNKALRESEERYRSLVETLPVMIFTLTAEPDKKIQSVNPEFEKTTGWAASEAIGKSFLSIIHPDDIKSIRQMNQGKDNDALSGISHYELRIETKSGGYLISELTTLPQIVNGCIVSEVCVARDITERKKYEENLKKFKMAIEQAANSVIISDKEQKIEYVNKEFEKLTGYAKEEIIGKTPIMLKSFEHDEKFYDEMLNAIFSGNVYSGIIINKKKNGELYYEEKTITPIKNVWGEITNFIETGKDITERIIAEKALKNAHDELERRVEERTSDLKTSNERLIKEIQDRKEAEAALARSESVYREAIENASGVPYRYFFADGKYDFIGNEIFHLCGLYPNEVSPIIIGEYVKEYIILEPDAPSDINEYWRVFREGKVDKYRVDLRMQTKNGEMKWLNDCSVPIKDEKTGEIIGTQGILQDITQRKIKEEQARLQQEQLVQAEKMASLGILVSGVAHEINNPNNFIMLNTPIIREAWESALRILDMYYKENGDFLLGGLNYSEMRGSIPVLFSGILDGTNRIKNIVQELRDFARKHPVEMMEPVDMNAIVKSALTLTSNMIKKCTDKFSVEYDKNLPLFRGNFQRLEQIVINLIQNACQALPDKTKGISIKTNYDSIDKCVLLNIRDEGSGISPDKLKHVCDPFFTTKRDTGGTGLGLSISANIIREHNGILKITSELNKGTTVTVKIPVYVKK